MIRKYILLLFLAICCLGCEIDKTVDTTVMPEISNTGANTFGCLIDGWLYVGGRYEGIVGWDSPAKNSISFRYDKDLKEMDVEVFVDWNNSISFTIQSPREGEETIFCNTQFEGEELENGTVRITRFDEKQRIISGTFYGGRITHGRFDVYYKNYYKAGYNQ